MIQCTECFKNVEIKLGKKPIDCPACGSPIRCHTCGATEPEHEWKIAPSVDAYGIWCGVECVGRSAVD